MKYSQNLKIPTKVNTKLKTVRPCTGIQRTLQFSNACVDADLVVEGNLFRMWAIIYEKEFCRKRLSYKCSSVFKAIPLKLFLVTLGVKEWKIWWAPLVYNYSKIKFATVPCVFAQARPLKP